MTVDTGMLRPVERRILRLIDEGVDEAEIGRRFRRTPEFVERVRAFTELPRHGGVPDEDVDVLRSVERRILKWRAQGADHAEIGRRFLRSPGHVERVERLANYKLEAADHT
jgi:DNA-binding CsgD family transcriptional regulator